tara:strand:+ start:586 stop:807 length:222 start_codon:yes stop_codon:yes gene_type:complete
MKKKIEGVYIHVKGRNCKTVWNRFRAFSEWMLNENIFPISSVGGIRGANEFSGMFTKEEIVKVETKLAELGIK